MRISVPNPTSIDHKRIYYMRNGKKTFTLVELIVVVVVLGIIAALAVGTFQTVRGASAENIALQSAEQVARNAENAKSYCRSILLRFLIFSHTVTFINQVKLYKK